MYRKVIIFLSRSYLIPIYYNILMNFTINYKMTHNNIDRQFKFSLKSRLSAISFHNDPVDDL